MTLRVEMTHRFPDLTLNIRFEAPTPAVTAVFGPSGCGKSTLLAAISGLLKADRCAVALDDMVLSDLPVERRRVGFVFQSARLFPHISVAGNLRYGQRRVPAGPTGFDDIVGMLDIAPLLGRRPSNLSGGERQRVAIGRALLAQPRLLLMDEPLASLDDTRKAEILPYLANVKAHLRLPIVYVTHSAQEVARLADWLVLLEPGHVAASGALDDLTARGDLPFGRRDDAGSVLTATVESHHAGMRLSFLRIQQTRLIVPLARTAVEKTLRVRIPAREVILARQAPEAISVHNIIPGVVRAITDDPVRHAALVEVGLPDGAILARVTSDAVMRLELRPGAPVLALVKSVAIEVLEQ